MPIIEVSRKEIFDICLRPNEYNAPDISRSVLPRENLWCIVVHIPLFCVLHPDFSVQYPALGCFVVAGGTLAHGTGTRVHTRLSDRRNARSITRRPRKHVHTFHEPYNIAIGNDNLSASPNSLYAMRVARSPRQNTINKCATRELTRYTRLPTPRSLGRRVGEGEGELTSARRTSLTVCKIRRRLTRAKFLLEIIAIFSRVAHFLISWLNITLHYGRGVHTHVICVNTTALHTRVNTIPD